MGDYTDTLYCCGSDFSDELSKNRKYFSFLEDLKLKRPCWKECGIVQVILDLEGNQIFSHWIEPGV